MNKQKGFGTVEILLVVLVVAVLGFGGYYVWNNQKKSANKTDNSSQANSETKKDATPETKDETMDWLLYESPGKEYTVRLADGWTMERYEKSASIYQFDNTVLAYKSGTKANVVEVNGGKDGSAGLFISYADQNTDQVSTKGEKQTSLKTVDGLEVQKFYNVVSEEPEAIGPAKGSKEYRYVIRPSANKVIAVTYTIAPGSADYYETVEKVVKTVHFN